MVNYNQAYLESLVFESLVKPGSTRLSILVDNCQKLGKSGSTRVYQVHQAFNQTYFWCKGLSFDSLCAIISSAQLRSPLILQNLFLRSRVQRKSFLQLAIRAS